MLNLLKDKLDRDIIKNSNININKKIINVVDVNSKEPRHISPATKEWHNAIYSFNKNTIRNIPVFYNRVNNLIKNFFNLGYYRYYRIISKFTRTRRRRLSQKRIFISKAEMKHTNNKVNIVIYTYNREIKALKRKFKKIFRKLNLDMIKWKYLDFKKAKYNKKNRKILRKLYYYIKKLRIKDKSILFKYGKNSMVLKKFKFIFFKYPILNKKINKIFLKKNKSKKIKKNIQIESNAHNVYKIKKRLYTDIFNKTLKKRLLTYSMVYNILKLNNNKFKNTFLFKDNILSLNNIISKIYEKKIEFNIVNLKYLHLNSDIFSESISTYLKNKKKKLLRILKKALKLVKVPSIYINTYEKNSHTNNYILNKKMEYNIGNLIKNNESSNSNNILYRNSDKFMEILLHIKQKTLNNQYKKNNFYINNVLKDIKYKTISGIRLQAKGRLSKRLTASRSIFKYKYKGTLKNIESSYVRLSTAMLRGHVKSGLQYTITNSKTRIGAFSLKNWMNSY